MSEPVELRCGMCDGSGVNTDHKRGACEWCDGTTTVMAHLDGKYVHRDAVMELWEAATIHWDSISDMFDSSTALPGGAMKGRDLYRIAQALSITDAERER